MRRIGVLMLAACGGSAMSNDASGPDAPAIVEAIHFIGRFDAMHRFAWPGTQIATRFVGTEIAVELADTGMNWFDIMIDGITVGAPLQPSGSRATYTLATGLSPGEHDLVLARRTESFFGPTTFYGFPGATLVATPRATRLIEFVGDSITCGYGVLGATAACSFTAATEAETHAWGTLAATALSATHVSIAYSGLGVVRNYGGDTAPTLRARYGLTFAEDATSTWDFSYTPDAIVIDLGTNDFSTGDPGSAFVTGYADFVRTLRAHFASTPILLATSPLLTDPARSALRSSLDQVVAAVADSKVTIVDIATQLASDGYGCDYHPNEATQRKMADQIVPAIRTATGW